jgi:integrase
MADLDIREHRNRGVTELHVKSLESRWRTILRDEGATTPLNQIAYDWAREYEGRRRASGVRGQTIVREVQAVRRALKIAVRKEILSEAPDDWPTIRRNPPDTRLAGKLWSPEQIHLFLGALHQDARDEVEFDVLTGLRSAELKRVQAGWVCAAPESAGVPALLRIPAWAAKTRRERVVGLPERALAITNRRARAYPAAEFIFSQSEFKRHRTAVCKRLGFEMVLTLRDLRHTFASLALQGKGDPAAVMAALGHKDLAMTQRYLTSPLERTAALGAVVAEKLGGGQ